MSFRCLSTIAFLMAGRPASGPFTFLAWIRPARTTRGMAAPFLEEGRLCYRSMASLPKLRILVLLGIASGACRSTQAPRPGAPAVPPDAVRSYVGQTLILRHRGDEKKWSLDKKALEKQSGNCDVAVQVVGASLDKGEAQLRLEYLGQPRTESWRSQCKRQVPEIALRVTGFRSEETTDGVRSALGWLLPTPDAWLNLRGARLDLSAPTGDPKLVADRSTVAAEAEMRFARDVTRWPRRRLWIEPSYSDPGKIKHEGEVEIAAVAGADGRLYRARVTTPLEEPHQRAIERSFPLWRFEPARKTSEAVAARVTERTVFRIY